MTENEVCKILDDMAKQFGCFEDYDRCVKFKIGTLEFYMESLTKENLLHDIKNSGLTIALHLVYRIETSIEDGGVDFESCLKFKTKKWWKVSYNNHLTKTYINIIDRSPGK